ncbi:hypothetical protein BZA70DRAFT_66192 [Myxozyma melibiosi]|uniref:DUF1746 domain-containing protein n=1 Tax=Myxozyma melibiosi TaxID=54550 RepID=A0ABR1F0X9_9ASCO
MPPPPTPTSSTSSPSSASRPRLKLLEKRRQEFGRHLIRSLDILSYCHLLYIYFMDISLLRLLLRSVIQLNYLTPKPFPMPRTARTRLIHVVILASNTYCLLVHIFANLPVSREANAGYLHGGLSIQFIGQKAPASRTQLLAADIVVLVLQLVILTIAAREEETSNPPALTMPASFSAAAAMAARTAARASLAEQQRRQQPPSALGPSTSPPPVIETPPPVEERPRQTIEDEENGRSAAAAAAAGATTEEDGMSLLQAPDEQDGFTGEVIAAELHLSEIIGRLRSSGSAASSSSGSAGAGSEGQTGSGSSRYAARRRVGASVPV